MSTDVGAAEPPSLTGALDDLSLSELFELLTATEGLTGVFADLHWQGLTGHVTVALEYTHNSVFVNIVPLLLPGDFNLDGKVDVQDYTVWRNSLMWNSGDACSYSPTAMRCAMRSICVSGSAIERLT